MTYIHGTDSTEQIRLSLLNKLVNPAFVRFADLSESHQVLELGSGTGLLGHAMSTRYPECKITGVEISKTQIKTARKNAPHVSFVPGNITNLPFAANKFDAVYGRFIFEHVDKPLCALTEARRVMKTNAHIFIQENDILKLELFPTCKSFEKAWQKFVKLQEQMGGDALIGKKLYSYLLTTGFKKIKCSIAPQVHYAGEGAFTDWIENIAGNLRGAHQQLIDARLLTNWQFNNAMDELENFKTNPLASSYFYWNRVRAQA